MQREKYSQNSKNFITLISSCPNPIISKVLFPENFSYLQLKLRNVYERRSGTTGNIKGQKVPGVQNYRRWPQIMAMA